MPPSRPAIGGRPEIKSNGEERGISVGAKTEAKAGGDTYVRQRSGGQDRRTCTRQPQIHSRCIPANRGPRSRISTYRSESGLRQF